MTNCTITECNKPEIARGYCSAHYALYRKYGSPYIKKDIRNTIEDFWNRINKTNTCWIWLSNVDKDGYGLFWWKNRSVRAHRFMLNIVNKIELGDKEVCHTCDNPTCVNPAHLFLATSKENQQDAVRKGRKTRGEKCHTAILTEKQVKEIRERLKNGESRKDMTRMFKVGKTAIDFIARGRTWKHLL